MRGKLHRSQEPTANRIFLPNPRAHCVTTSYGRALTISHSLRPTFQLCPRNFHFHATTHYTSCLLILGVQSSYVSTERGRVSSLWDLAYFNNVACVAVIMAYKYYLYEEEYSSSLEGNGRSRPKILIDQLLAEARKPYCILLFAINSQTLARTASTSFQR